MALLPLLALVGLGMAVALAQTSISNDQVIAHLNKSIEWYRQIGSEQQLATEPNDLLFLTSARATALQALRQAFEFARAKAAMNAALRNQQASSDGSTNPEAERAQRVAQSASAAISRVQQLQSQLEALEAQIEKAPASKRPALLAQRDQLKADINLQEALRDTLQNFGSFLAGAGISGGLQSEIGELERSVPEVSNESAKGAAPAGAPASASTLERNDSAGILKLSTSLFSLTRKIHRISDLVSQTSSLRDSTEQLRAPLLAELKQTAQLANSGPTQDPKTLNAMAAQFRQLASIALPLGKQSVLLEATRSDLLQWRGAVEREYAVLARGLFLRLVVLAILITVLLVLSDFWRRTIFRYVTDARRRSQYLLLRRIVVAFVAILIVILGLATELGSFATFAGFLTAGLALALQNVILSVVAYFFLIGRYGVRVGDRITISGVTGDVVEIGIVRLYLLELAGSGSDFRPSGRIVVFPNAVLFQPGSNLYKQLPGTNYVWHQVALTLAPESDYQLAERRLMDAINSVYEEYRAELERQHVEVARSINIKLAPPKPEGHLRLVESGLEVLLRYPVETHRAAEIDDRVTRRLLEALQQEPKLRMVPSGTPRIQPGIEAAAVPAKP